MYSPSAFANIANISWYLTLILLILCEHKAIKSCELIKRRDMLLKYYKGIYKEFISTCFFLGLF